MQNTKAQKNKDNESLAVSLLVFAIAAIACIATTSIILFILVNII